MDKEIDELKELMNLSIKTLGTLDKITVEISQKLDILIANYYKNGGGKFEGK